MFNSSLVYRLAVAWGVDNKVHEYIEAKIKKFLQYFLEADLNGSSNSMRGNSSAIAVLSRKG